MKNRVFIGISETSGFYARLNQGFHEIGVDSFFVELTCNKHNYKENNTDNRLTRKCREYYSKQKGPFFIKLYYYFLFQICKFFVFAWSLFNFETFIFTQCKGFWGVKELWIYKLFKKKVMMICLGSATRLPYADGTEVYGIYRDNPPTTKELVNYTKQKRRNIQCIEKQVDYFINLPSQAQMNQKPFISLCNIGIPVSVNNTEVQFKRKNKKICILHAASYIGCRGTEEFRKVIYELKETYDIEYVELSGVSNKEVLNKIRKCDFILDELYSDTPMATFASEAAWFAKPAIVCGYFALEYKKYYKSDMLPPSIYIKPSELKNTIIQLIENPKFRNEIGLEAQKFVRNKMSNKRVAERVKRVLEGQCPIEWYVNPLEIGYINGYGISANKLCEIVKKICNDYGETGLQLEENSLLKERMKEIIEKNKKEIITRY